MHNDPFLSGQVLAWTDLELWHLVFKEVLQVLSAHIKLLGTRNLLVTLALGWQFWTWASYMCLRLLAHLHIRVVREDFLSLVAWLLWLKLALWIRPYLIASSKATHLTIQSLTVWKVCLSTILWLRRGTLLLSALIKRGKFSLIVLVAAWALRAWCLALVSAVMHVTLARLIMAVIAMVLVAPTPKIATTVSICHFLVFCHGCWLSCVHAFARLTGIVLLEMAAVVLSWVAVCHVYRVLDLLQSLHWNLLICRSWLRIRRWMLTQVVLQVLLCRQRVDIIGCWRGLNLSF